MSDLREFLKGKGLDPYLREEVKICSFCGGTGEVTRYETTDWHKNQVIRQTSFCEDCGGSGRVYNQTLNLYGFRPFKEKEDGN